MALYKLDAELASAYAQGLITDPEDLQTYEKLLKDVEYRRRNNFAPELGSFQKVTKLGIYRRIYPKIKVR